MLLVVKLIIAEIARTNRQFYRDARTSHLPLLGSPWPLVGILTLYMLFVNKWGPSFMRNRKPYQLVRVLQAYNVLQIFVNLYVFVESVHYSYWQPDFSFTCQSYNPKDMRTTHMYLRYSCYVYYICKYLDLLDTLFFVLRKKYKQISFLHVYHHAIMVYAVWAYATLIFASHFTATGCVNSFVHVCMYTYYFFAALKLDSIDLTPWKKRLTQLQILQFLFLTFHAVLPILNNWCKLDVFWLWVFFVQNVFMLVLFSDFYYKAYMRKSVQLQEVQDAVEKSIKVT